MSFEEFGAKVDKKKISCDFVALKEGEVKCHNFTILGHINVCLSSNHFIYDQ